MPEFHTIDEILEHYTPDYARKLQQDQMTIEEHAQEMARELVAEFRRALQSA